MSSVLLWVWRGLNRVSNGGEGMLVYFVFLAAVGLWSILYARFKSNPGFSKTLYALMCIALTCLMGFRSTVVGVDTYAYSTYFTKIAQSNDPGYYMNVVSSAPVYSAYNTLSLIHI